MGTVKHYLQFKDLGREEYDYLFDRSRRIKEMFKSYQQYWPLTDRTLVMIFEKASTRTRLSFEAGMQQLGGSAIYLNTRDSQLGRGEPVEDAAQVISRMSDIVMIRTFEQEDHRALRRQLARSGDQRPDQRISPTVPDHGRHLHLHRAPRPDPGQDRWPGSAIRTTSAIPGCRQPKCSISTCTCRRRRVTRWKPSVLAFTVPTTSKQFADPMDAVPGADLVTTDVWTSMGFEAENERSACAISPTGGSTAT